MGVTVQENVAVAVCLAALTISVSDAVSVNEAVTTRFPFHNVSVSDTTTVTEDVKPNLILKIRPITTPGVQLWSKLGSDSEITSPAYGTGGAIVGSPTYNGGKFGNGIEIDVDNEGCTFPTSDNNINIDKGAIEFWAKLNFSPTDADLHCLFDFYDGSNGGIRLYFDPDDDDFYVYVHSGGPGVASCVTVGLSWSAGDILHFAVTWDREGIALGDSKTLVLYVDNIEKGSSTTTWSIDTVNANLYIGTTYTGILYADAVIDNLKTFNICKTDFSDKDTEGIASGPAESIIASEFVSTAIPGPQISVYDTVSLTESVSAAFPGVALLIDIYDEVTLTESIARTLVNLISVNDSITVAEAVSLLLPFLNIDVSDSASLTESITALNPFLNIDTSDSVAVSEAYRAIFGWITEAIITTTWTDVSPSATTWEDVSPDTATWTDVDKPDKWYP